MLILTTGEGWQTTVTTLEFGPRGAQARPSLPTISNIIRMGGIPHEQAHHQPQGDGEDGIAPYLVGHSQRSEYTRSLGLHDTQTEARRGHHWLFNDWG